MSCVLPPEGKQGCSIAVVVVAQRRSTLGSRHSPEEGRLSSERGPSAGLQGETAASLLHSDQHSSSSLLSWLFFSFAPICRERTSRKKIVSFGSASQIFFFLHLSS